MCGAKEATSPHRVLTRPGHNGEGEPILPTMVHHDCESENKKSTNHGHECRRRDRRYRALGWLWGLHAYKNVDGHSERRVSDCDGWGRVSNSSRRGTRHRSAGQPPTGQPQRCRRGTVQGHTSRGFLSSGSTCLQSPQETKYSESKPVAIRANTAIRVEVRCLPIPTVG